MLESPNLRSIWMAACQVGRTVLFRVNTGKAWVASGRPKRLQDGTVLLPGGRPISLGFSLASGDPVVGAADLVGWHSLVVTPAMVGARLAVFASVEAKRTDNGRASRDQLRWMDTVRQAGGIACIANTPAVAQDAIRSFVDGLGPHAGPDAEPDTAP